jgi:hypothetical protein
MRPFNRSIFVIIGFIVQKKVHMPMCTFNEIGVSCSSHTHLLKIMNKMEFQQSVLQFVKCFTIYYIVLEFGSTRYMFKNLDENQ